MDRLLQDLRFGVRLIRKAPGFSALAVLTFTLGIGVNIAIFSVVDAVVWRPLAIPEPDRFVRILNEDPAHLDRGSMSSWIEVERFGTESRALAGVAASDRRAVIVKRGDEAQMLLTNVVSKNYFDVLRVAAAAGRTFTRTELEAADAPPVVVLSYDYWQRQYAGDPHLVGQTIVASDVPCLVIGILPRTFRGTEAFLNPDVYLPISTWITMNPGERVRLERPQARNLEVFGRLGAGRTPAQAGAALALVQQQLASDYPQYETGRRQAVKYERDTRGPQAATISSLLFGIAVLVLLIACVNVANLLLARGEARRQEIATRLALGASRGRAVRQLITETIALAACGAAGAVLLASWLIDLMRTMTPPSEFAVGFDLRLDLRVLAFGAVATMASAALAGLLPALAIRDVAIARDTKDVIGQPGGPRGRWRDVMLIGQVAVTVLLLTASGLLIRSLMAVREFNPGFDVRGNVLIARLSFRNLPLPQEHALDRRLLERVAALPGVQAVSIASRIPMWGSGGGAAALAWRPALPEADRDGIRIGFAVVSPGYFTTLGTRIVGGRPITAQDSETSPPAVVLNETAARALWPAGDALGKHFRLNGPNGRDVEVVGIAENGRYLALTENQRSYMFLPLLQEAQIFGSRWGADVLVVRTAANPSGELTAIRHALRDTDPNVLMLSATTMDEHVRGAMYGERLTAQLVGAMGILGLVLAAVGLFGVVSYSVSRRTREIGVRMALGADSGSVVHLVLRRAFLLAGSGIASGVVLAIALGPLLRSLLFAVSVRDPITIGGAAAAMGLVALLAAALPARKAARLDPLKALRTE